jgi:hypothetical protein
VAGATWAIGIRIARRKWGNHRPSAGWAPAAKIPGRARSGNAADPGSARTGAQRVGIQGLTLVFQLSNKLLDYLSFCATYRMILFCCGA